MRKPSVLAAVLVSVLLPIQALAAVCFTPSPFPNVIMFEVVGSGTRYYVLAGEDWGACTGNPSTGSMPLQGTAYMRGDGSVEIGLNVLSSDADAKCNAYGYQGTLHPPDYSGTGFVGFLSGTKVPVTFVPAACPKH